VAATRLRVSPLELATSVRIVDSLAAGTSHFYAELKRLKYVVDCAKAHERGLLYLLDEMLHGTNSRERFIAATSVIRWLSSTGAMGIVTTHDLKLAKVADDLPEGLAANYHFSDDVKDGQISFDYSLRQGPVVSTNALRLMRAVGIDVELVEER
jgi:DNA mismatch repair ATPase MutS